MRCHELKLRSLNGADSYGSKCAVWQLYPGFAENNRPFIYTYYSGVASVRSFDAPDTSRVPAGWQLLMQPRYAGYAIVDKHEHDFRLYAYASYQEGKKHKALRTGHDVWVRDALSGARILDLSIERESYWVKVDSKPNNKPFDLPVSKFEGRLLIEDAAKVERHLLHGVGRGKVWGAGMLFLY